MRRTRDPLKLLRAAEEAPWKQDFYRLLREVESAYPDKPRLGTSLRPQDDAVRLAQEPSLSFAPATFSAVEPATAVSPPRLVQRFFGLLGPNGPLPLHLTEFARERLIHARDPAMVRFFDALQHRLLTLFYRVWAQAHPAVSLDRRGSDRFGAYVGSLIGMGTPALRQRDAAGDHVRYFFSGALSRQPRTAEGLRSLLAGFFRLPVRVVEFSGHWMPLPQDDLTRLGGDSAGARLGRGAVIGARVWDRQHRIQLCFGPLNYEQYQSLLPGGESLRKLVALTRHYLSFELAWDLRLSLRREDVPTARLGQGTRLGWTSWLGTSRTCPDAENLVLDVERVAGAAIG